MASGKTTTYELNQWAASDPVLRADFNADNEKLDTALSALQGRVRYGTFTGNGSGSRTMDLGFTPTILIMMSQSSSGCIISITSATYSYYIYGGGAGMSDSRIIENGIQIRNTLNNNSTILCNWIAIV